MISHVVILLVVVLGVFLTTLTVTEGFVVCRVPSRGGGTIWYFPAAVKSTTNEPSHDDDDLPNVLLPNGTVTKELTFVTSKRVVVRSMPRRRRLFSTRQRGGRQEEKEATLTYTYKYDMLMLGPPVSSSQSSSSSSSTTTTTATMDTIGIVLIHPIGVGISRWFYERLLHALVAAAASWQNARASSSSSNRRYIIFVAIPLEAGSGRNP